MNFTEWISIAKDIVVGLSAAAAAFFAWRGLTVWKKQLKGKEDHELARQVLVDLSDLRSLIAGLATSLTSKFTIGTSQVDTSDFLLTANAFVKHYGWVYNKFSARYQTIRESLQANVAIADVLWNRDGVLRNDFESLMIGFDALRASVDFMANTLELLSKIDPETPITDSLVVSIRQQNDTVKLFADSLSGSELSDELKRTLNDFAMQFKDYILKQRVAL